MKPPYPDDHVIVLYRAMGQAQDPYDDDIELGVYSNLEGAEAAAMYKGSGRRQYNCETDGEGPDMEAPSCYSNGTVPNDGKVETVLVYTSPMAKARFEADAKAKYDQLLSAAVLGLTDQEKLTLGLKP
mgnify:CR=1 FL=1